MLYDLEAPIHYQGRLYTQVLTHHDQFHSFHLQLLDQSGRHPIQLSQPNGTLFKVPYIFDLNAQLPTADGQWLVQQLCHQALLSPVDGYTERYRFTKD